MKIGKIQLKNRELPLIPIRELIVFPHVMVPFFVGRKSSIKALEEAMGKDRNILLAYQKNDTETPTPEDIYKVATVCHILQILKLPDGNIRVLVEGKDRVELQNIEKKGSTSHGTFQIIPEENSINKETAALMHSVQLAFKSYSKQRKKIPREVMAAINRAETPEKLIGNVCVVLQGPIEQKINFLSTKDNDKRLQDLAVALELENELLNIKEDIDSRVKKKMEKNQKEYFLNEQLRQINKELGTEEADQTGARELEEKLKKMDLPSEVQAKIQTELKRLSRLQPMSPDSGILRTYLEWISDLPWKVITEDRRDIQQAAQILDNDHYNLKKAKERILDFIAILQLQSSMKGPILCLVGPPGTGKTSLGRSVARALNRNFVRISLGGVRDEAEIRGHRKTYVGALPGKIIQSLKKAGSANPVFLLDEIDKMSNDYRGDPSAALLEVLDPEQNSTFLDHYLELNFDLSKVMFITTANSVHNIPYPLLDRMEIIEIPGYTEYEKKMIARNFILPKQLKENGMENVDLDIDEPALDYLIQNYTMESGVRNLARELGKLIRKSARESIAQYNRRSGRHVFNSDYFHKNKEFSGFYSIDDDVLPLLESEEIKLTKEKVKEYLGKEKFSENSLNKEQRSGLAVGMAWTEAGGRVLPVEATLLTGSGKLILTGKLGDVMKESAQIALSFIKANTKELGIEDDFYKEKDIHIHVPEGAIPKDGPSAGITMTAALVSAIRKIPLNKGFAMTGEITLTDRLLPIGGVKEKVLAAHRHGIKSVILPQRNRRDKDELPEEVRKKMKFFFFGSVKEALVKLFPKDTFIEKK